MTTCLISCFPSIIQGLWVVLLLVLVSIAVQVFRIVSVGVRVAKRVDQVTDFTFWVGLVKGLFRFSKK